MKTLITLALTFAATMSAANLSVPKNLDFSPKVCYSESGKDSTCKVTVTGTGLTGHTAEFGDLVAKSTVNSSDNRMIVTLTIPDDAEGKKDVTVDTVTLGNKLYVVKIADKEDFEQLTRGARNNAAPSAPKATPAKPVVVPAPAPAPTTPTLTTHQTNLLALLGGGEFMKYDPETGKPAPVQVTKSESALGQLNSLQSNQKLFATWEETKGIREELKAAQARISDLEKGHQIVVGAVEVFGNNLEKVMAAEVVQTKVGRLGKATPTQLGDDESIAKVVDATAKVRSLKKAPAGAVATPVK